MFRLAQIDDINAINDIYNQAVNQLYQTADFHAWSIEDRIRWFHDHPSETFPIYILDQGGQVAGWASLSKYRHGRDAFSTTAEISYYLNQEFQGQGLGSQLLAFMIEQAALLNFEYLVSILLGSNERSIALLKKFGFKEWGRLPGIAKINGDQIDHLYMGLHL